MIAKRNWFRTSAFDFQVYKGGHNSKKEHHQCVITYFFFTLFSVSEMDRAARDNRANQCNPNHAPTGPGKFQHNFFHGSLHWNEFSFATESNSEQSKHLCPLWQLIVCRLSACNTSNNRSAINKCTSNPLKPKRRPLYLKPQSVPRCKHFSSRL